MGISKVIIRQGVKVRCFLYYSQCAKFDYFVLFSAIFSWRAIASQYYILVSGYNWLAIARQEKIANT